MPLVRGWFSGQEDWHITISYNVTAPYINLWIYGMSQNMQALLPGMVYQVGTILV